MPDITETDAAGIPDQNQDLAVTRPDHPVHALATFELSRYRRDLEHAITGTSPDAPAQDSLRRQLDDVLAEQESRIQIRRASRKGAPGQ
jgi:hypothetical protein